MFEKTAVRIASVVAVLLVIVVVLVLLFNNNEKTEPGIVVSIPSSDEILFGLSYKDTIECDTDKVEDYVLSDIRFADYTVKDEYCMLFQIASEAQEAACKTALGVTAELPEIDFRKHRIVLSVGREIERISDKKKTLTEDGDKVVTVIYGEEYHEDTIFVYTTRDIDFLSGLDLEVYYLENVHPYSNLVEGERETSAVVSEGKYHRVYLKKGGLYEYVLMNKEDGTPVSRAVLEDKPEITEHSDTMVQVFAKNVTFFYNPSSNIYSQTSTNRLIYVVNNIVAFARVYNGEVIFVIRDVYDHSVYGNSYRVQFTQDPDNVRSLLLSVKYIDPEHIELQYYKGMERKLVTEEMKIVKINH